MSADVSGSHELPIVDEPVFKEVSEDTPPDDEKSGRALALSLGLAAAVLTAAGWAGYEYFIEEEPLPQPEALIQYDADARQYRVDCSEMVDVFRPRSEAESDIFLGMPLTSSGGAPSQVFRTYQEHEAALVAHACQKKMSGTVDETAGQIYAVRPEFMPAGSDGNTFTVSVVLSEVG